LILECPSQVAGNAFATMQPYLEIFLPSSFAQADAAETHSEGLKRGDMDEKK
jgi:hypothetical protein